MLWSNTEEGEECELELPLIEGADSEVGAEEGEEKLEVWREVETAQKGGTTRLAGVPLRQRRTWWSGGLRVALGGLKVFWGSAACYPVVD
jgi:hypothetical protein